MPRPKKYRRVCELPGSNLFGPLTGPMRDREMVQMSVEEYEVIRLVDLEALSQEDAAQRMMVARSTAQRIYMQAKHKVADALVNGKILKIDGGDYELCSEPHVTRGCGGCRRLKRLNAHEGSLEPFKGENNEDRDTD